jgi:hypothetical protein
MFFRGTPDASMCCGDVLSLKSDSFSTEQLCKASQAFVREAIVVPGEERNLSWPT